MKQFRVLKNDKNGEIMTESLIVYLVTIMLLFLLLAIFSTLYQRWNIQIVANESATKYAQVYRFKTVAADITGEVTKDELVKVPKYRYAFDNDAYRSAAESKLRTYTSARLSKTSFTKDVTEPVMTVDVKNDSLGRRHLIVTITGEYSVPFGEILDYFGYESTTKYTVVSYAECLDIIDYINTVDFIDQATSLDWLGSGTVELINAVLKLFNNIFGT